MSRTALVLALAIAVAAPLESFGSVGRGWMLERFSIEMTEPQYIRISGYQCRDARRDAPAKAVAPAAQRHAIGS
jgi:hypothetical protein